MIENSESFVVIEGVVGSIQEKQLKMDFLNIPTKKIEKMENIVIALGAMTGNSPASTTGFVHSSESESVWIEFALGERIVKGWVWRSFFRNGDFVKVVACKKENYFECFAILRPLDKIIAVFPYASHGLGIHKKNFKKSSFYLFLIFLFFSFVAYAFKGNNPPVFALMALGIGAVIMSVNASVYFGKKKFCIIAEKIFEVLRWKNGTQIDLEMHPVINVKPDGVDNEIMTLNFRYSDDW